MFGLNKVVLTGIDNNTDIAKLVELQKKYPFVEWGILISESMNGSVDDLRYPDLSSLNKLKGKGLKLSCHLCGKVARLITQKNNWSLFESMVGENKDIFQRIQLNVGRLKTIATDIVWPKEFDFILQVSKTSSLLYAFYKVEGVVNVFPFQDSSGGRGRYNNSWLAFNADYCGYAGGLDINNIDESLAAISKVANSNYWVDMETSLRDSNDLFDLNMCEKILEKCSKYIV